MEHTNQNIKSDVEERVSDFSSLASDVKSLGDSRARGEALDSSSSPLHGRQTRGSQTQTLT